MVWVAIWPHTMSARGLPFTDENQPPEPQYLPSHTRTPNWSNHGPPGLTYYNNITPWNTSAPNSPVDLRLPFTTAGPSHFRQPPWNPQTPSPGQSFQFTAHQPPLSNTTNNSSHVPLDQRSKRTATSQPGSRAKRRRTAAAPAEIETAPICGVGPSRLDPDLLAATPSADTVPVTVPPLQGYKSLATSRAAPSNAATDVWHFMRTLNQKEKPEEWPAKSPDGSELVEKPLDCRPKSAFVGCKLCSK